MREFYEVGPVQRASVESFVDALFSSGPLEAEGPTGGPCGDAANGDEASSTEQKPPLDEFHAHEACDRAAMFCNIIEIELLNHPFVQATPQAKEKIDAALSLIADAYQALGAARFGEKGKE